MDIKKSQSYNSPSTFHNISGKPDNRETHIPSDGYFPTEVAEQNTMIMHNSTGVSLKEAADALLSVDKDKTRDTLIDKHSLWSYDTSGSALSDSVYDPNTKTMYTGVGNAEKWHLTAFDEKGNIKWSLPEKTMSSPVLDSKGNIYVRTQTHLLALNPDGTEKWKYDTEYSTKNNSRPLLGPDGTVYLVMRNEDPDDYRNDSQITAVKDGKQLWNHKCAALGATPDLLIGKNGTLIASIELKSPKKGLFAKLYGETEIKKYLAGFDTKTGSEVFRQEVDFWNNWTNDTLSMGSDGTVYASHGYDKISAFEPGGKRKWTYQLKNRLYNDTQRPLQATPPAVDKDGNIYLASSSTGPHPEGYLIRLSRDGKETWCTTIKEGTNTRPHFNEKGNILVGTSDGHVLEFDASGKQTSKHVTGRIIGNNFAIGENGELFLNTHKKILAFQPNLSKLEEEKTKDSQEKTRNEEEQKQVKGIEIRDTEVIIGNVSLKKRKKRI